MVASLLKFLPYKPLSIAWLCVRVCIPLRHRTDVSLQTDNVKSHMSKVLLSLSAVLLSLASLTSCQQDQDAGFSTARHSSSEVIYQKRRVPIPELPRRQRTRSLSTDAPDLSLAPYNVLGAVHGIGNGFIGHPMNIGNDGVINVKSLLADKRTSKFLFNRNIDATTTQVQTYHSEEDIAKVVNETKKITTGFRLNLGLFSLGQKSTFRNRFHSETLASESHTWANVDLMYYANRVGIESTDAALTAIACRNLDDTFLYSIYNAPLANYVKEKGFLVVTDFYTGGRLTALIDHTSQGKVNKMTVNRDVDLAIGASFGWGGKSPKSEDSVSHGGKNSASLYIGAISKNGRGSADSVHTESSYASLSVYGGSKNSGLASGLVDVKTSAVNIGVWYASLSDPKLHKYIDVHDGGLVSLDKFMLEYNFKQRLKGILQGDLSAKTSLDVPYIEVSMICATSLDGNPQIPVRWTNAPGVILHTRQGDEVLFMNEDLRRRLKILETQPDTQKQIIKHDKEADSILPSLGHIFACEIRRESVWQYPGKIILEDPRGWRGNLTMWINFSFDNQIYKYQNPYTHIWYIYDPKNKSAFSYYDDPEDDDDDTYVTDLYGITDWVDSIKAKKISMLELATYYKIIGL